MTTYLYTKFSPKNEHFATQLDELTQQHPQATLFKDVVKGRVPPLERPEFSALLAQLVDQDTLVVYWLTAFSKNMQQCHDIMQTLLAKNITVQTIKPALTITPDSEASQIVLHMLEGFAGAETRHRLRAAHQGREALRGDKAAWNEKFRGRPANREKHQLIAASLLEGKTLEEVAQECDCSLSTVKRVKAKIAEHDEFGGLRHRGRGHHRGGRHEHKGERGHDRSGKERGLGGRHHREERGRRGQGKQQDSTTAE
ncbi:recombinase family protein [Vibrio tritonius]|uniref:recombinase family protein n=1 Tax=Vibrio tritonius TaxID=1435069 RepID=UPI0009E992FA|nr:recombinase family protein [Vibrio tritonius]